MSTRLRFALLCATTLFQFVALGVFLAALPLYITGPLDRSKAAVGLAVGSYSLSAVLVRPWVGRLVDRRGRRPYLSGGSALLAATAIALVGVHSLVLVVALRLVQGLAGAAFYTSAAAIATDLAPSDRRASYISRFSLFLYSGFAIGPALGEQLAHHLGFGWAWGAAALSAALALGAGALLPETRSGAQPGAHAGVVVARRGRFVHPAAVGPGSVLLCMAIGYATISTFAPLFVHRMGLGTAGPIYTTYAVVIIGARLVGGSLADRLGYARVALPGLLAGAAGYALLAAVPRPAAAYAGVAVFGVGFAVVFPALMALAVDGVAPSERGAVLGSYTAFFDVGASAGGYAVGVIADRAGFGAAFVLPLASCLVGAGVLARLRRQTGRAGAAIVADAAPLPEPAGA